MLIDRDRSLRINELSIQRDIEFALYNTSTKDFKRIKKASDLYKLPTDKEDKVYSGDEANEILATSGLVKMK